MITQLREQLESMKRQLQDRDKQLLDRDRKVLNCRQQFIVYAVVLRRGLSCDACLIMQVLTVHSVLRHVSHDADADC